MEERSRLGPALAVPLAAGLVYIMLISRRYNFDGLVFSFWLGRAVYGGETGLLFHPHHILYLPSGYIFARLLGFLDALPSMVLTLQLFNVILSLGVLWLFLAMARRLTEDVAVSAVFTAGLAFSWSYWFLSVEPEVYILYALLLLAGLALLIRVTQEGSRLPAFRTALGLGVMGALVAGGHLAGGLFMTAVLTVGFFYLGRGVEQPWRSLALAATSAAGFALVFAIFYGTGYELHPEAGDAGFARWFMDLADPSSGPGHRASYWDFSWSAPSKALAGYYHAVMAGPQFLDSDSRVLAAARVAGTAGLVSFLLAYLAFLPGFRSEDKRRNLLLLAAFLPLFAFTFIWEPKNFELKAPLLPLIWLMAAMGAARARKVMFGPGGRTAVLSIAALTVACILYHNLFGSMLPGSKEENNPDLARAVFVRERTEDDAVVYIAGNSGGWERAKIYLIYFGHRQTRVVDWMVDKGEFPDNLSGPLSADLGRRPVYAISELVNDGPALSLLEKSHGVPPPAVVELFRSRGIREVGRLNPEFILYRVGP